MKEQLFSAKSMTVESRPLGLTAKTRKPYAESGVIFMSEHADEQFHITKENSKFTHKPTMKEQGGDSIDTLDQWKAKHPHARSVDEARTWGMLSEDERFQKFQEEAQRRVSVEREIAEKTYGANSTAQLLDDEPFNPIHNSNTEEKEQDIYDEQVENVVNRQENVEKALRDAKEAEAVRELIDNRVRGQLRYIADQATLHFQDRVQAIKKDSIEGEMENEIGELLADSSLDASTMRSRAQEIMSKYQQVLRENIEDVRAQSRRAVEQAKTQEKRGGRIQDLNDIARYIMESNPTTWASDKFIIERQIKGEDGKPLPLLRDNPELERYPILEIKDGKEEIVQKNFVRWLRERIQYYHSFDPDQPVNFFGEIKVDAPDLFRSISVGQMYDDYGRYFKDENGGLHKQLREISLQHAWLVGTARNMDVQYRQGMSDDSKFAELLSGLFKPNTFGKEFQGVNTLASLFTMDANFDPDKPPNEGDMMVGDAMRNSYLFYYHMTDLEKLQELFPKLDTFFSKASMDKAIDAIMESNNRMPKKGSENFESEYAKQREIFLKEAELDKLMKLYGPDGKIQPDMMKGFLYSMNVFNPPQKSRLQIEIGKFLVRQVAGEQSGLLNDTANLNFAELTAYLMTYWTGAASRQDITFAALNAFTKTEHFQDYLAKQADPSRAGGIGNPFEFPLLKKITADPMTGIKTVSEKSTLAILEEIQYTKNNSTSDEEARKEIREIVSGWSYADRAFTQYAPQHVGNGFKEFHDRTSGREIRLDQFAKYDPLYGRIIYDQAKMISEVQEGLIKPSRYRWSTHKLPFWEEEREFIEASKDKGATYVTSTQAEKFFGPQVLRVAEQMYKHEINKEIQDNIQKSKKDLKKAKTSDERKRIKNHIHALGEQRERINKGFLDENARMVRVPKKDKNGNIERDKNGEIILELSPEVNYALHHPDFGRIATKAYLTSKFGAMLYSHTEHHGQYEHLDYATRELIISALGRIPAGIDGDEQDLRKTHITERYFTSYDLKLMRKMASNEEWRNFMRAWGADLGKGTAEATISIFKKLVKDIFKV